ncbi:MAG: beta-propeller domain-containing protein [Woeseiaceae bacterium]|nr:beta-propeller domain-containing protein [Woeseiaceae bacterium]
MKRISNPRSYFFVSSLILSLLALSGCGGSSSGPGPDDPAAEGLLKPVASPAELEDALKAGLTTLRSTGAAEDALTAGAAPPSGNFTGTYTQEKNVDEFDVVRYDGNHLYVAPRKIYSCCYVLDAALADGGVNTGEPPQSSIRIMATDPASADATLAGEIPLEDDISVQGMYLAGDRMFALTAQSVYGTYGDLWLRPDIWAPEKLGYRVYDVSDKGAPVLEADVTIDGVFVESRRIGNIVYIISRYAPNLPGLIYYPATSADIANNQDIIANKSLHDLLPTITIDGETQALVDPANCYISNDDQLPAHPVVTSITAVPIDDPKAFVNTCYNDEVYGAYLSGNAIYFPQILGYYWPDEPRTRIHKFALAGTSANYRGSGDLEGQVWRGGQADFRMSESGGDLRVVSTVYRQNRTDFVDHLLYVLREAPSALALDIVSRLPNDARPAPIGKPNEQLYGVRFLGNRAYLVTFLQIDPLYVIDLTNPADPYIAGELEVTGFSDFLHPVSDDLLLGVGTSQVGGVKVELFDVSTITAPLSRGSVLIGDQGAWSEARHDRHAFTYQADINGIDRFTIPVASWDNSTGNGGYANRLHLFEIHDKATPNFAALMPVGHIEPPQLPALRWVDRNRAFIHDDTVYYIQDEFVWSAFWNSPTIVNGPF